MPDYNIRRVEAISELVCDALDAPADDSQALKAVADALGLNITQPAIYYLTRTTIHACLNSLRQASRVELTVDSNRLLWHRVSTPNESVDRLVRMIT